MVNWALQLEGQIGHAEGIQESTQMSFKGEKDVHFTYIHTYPDTFAYKINPDAGTSEFPKRNLRSAIPV